jgi:hypothetical protein
MGRLSREKIVRTIDQQTKRPFRDYETPSHVVRAAAVSRVATSVIDEQGAKTLVSRAWLKEQQLPRTKMGNIMHFFL